MKFFVQKMMRNSVFLSNFLDSLFLSILFATVHSRYVFVLALHFAVIVFTVSLCFLNFYRAKK